MLDAKKETQSSNETYQKALERWSTLCYSHDKAISIAHTIGLPKHLGERSCNATFPDSRQYYHEAQRHTSLAGADVG
jgi:hypothetical protein